MPRNIQPLADDETGAGVSRRNLVLIVVAVLCLVAAAAALFAVLGSDSRALDSDEEITEITFNGADAATSLPAPPPGSRGVIGLSVEQGTAGSTVRVQGASFKAGKEFGPIDIFWDATEGKPLVTAEGPRFAVDITVPKDAPVLKDGHNIIAVQKTKAGELVNQASLRYFVVPGR